MELTTATQKNNNILLADGATQLTEDFMKPSERKIYKQNSFIEANTKDVSLSSLKEECIIPVFA